MPSNIDKVGAVLSANPNQQFSLSQLETRTKLARRAVSQALHQLGQLNFPVVRVAVGVYQYKGASEHKPKYLKLYEELSSRESKSMTTEEMGEFLDITMSEVSSVISSMRQLTGANVKRHTTYTLTK